MSNSLPQELWQSWTKDSSLSSLNQKAWDLFLAEGYPKSNNNLFSFINTRPLALTSFTALEGNEDIQALPLESKDATLLRFVNGQLDEASSHFGAEYSKLNLSKFSESKEQDSLLAKWSKKVEESKDAFILQHYAFLKDVTIIDIPKNIILEHPLQIQAVSTTTSTSIAANFSKVVLRLGKSSSAKIAVQQSVSANVFSNRSLDIHVADNAQLQLVRYQEGHEEALELMNILIEQEANSRFTMQSCYLGSKLMRNNTEAHILGPGAEANFQGVSVINQKLQAHNHLTLTHHTPHSVSNQEFSHAGLGEAQVSFDGTVIVGKGAIQTYTDQLIRNLMLSDSVRMSGKPNLKIYNDDVKCAHGNTCGQLEESEIFYLQSRGFSRKQAKDVLTRAFVQHLVNEIPFAQTREAIDQRMLSRLNEIE